MFALLAGGAGAGDTLRCGSRLVPEDARAAQIIAVCGEPDYRDVWNVPHPYSGRWVSDVEQWYYNFGSNQLLRVLTLRGGRLQDVATDGYGFAESQPPRCDPALIGEGMTKYRLLAICGEPLTRQVQSLHRPWPRGGGLQGYGPPRYWEAVYREEWVYNFGPQYFMRIVTLENGRIVDVENGERGFRAG